MSVPLRGFWEAYVAIDARNHEWQCHDRMRAQDWPRFAREVADALAAARDPSALIEDRIGYRRAPVAGIATLGGDRAHARLTVSAGLSNSTWGTPNDPPVAACKPSSIAVHETGARGARPRGRRRPMSAGT